MKINIVNLFCYKKHLKLNSILSWVLLFFLFPSLSFADAGECKIEGSMAPVLLEYLSNVDTISNGVISQAKSWGKKNAVVNYMKYVTTSLGGVISFWDFFSSVSFNIGLPILYPVPSDVTRDQEKLMKKSEELIYLLKNLEKSWYGSTIIWDPCFWVKDCNLESWEARGILVKLIENNEMIVQFYRYSILDSKYKLKKGVILVPKDFDEKMWEYYNEYTLFNCMLWENGTVAEMEWKVAELGKIFNGTSKWYRSWKEAIDLATWINTKKEEKTEAEILRKYVSSIWLSTSQSQTILKNLEDYNSAWMSTWKPHVSSRSVNYAVDETKDAFKEAVSLLFDDNDNISPRSINELMPEIQTTVNIKNEIRNMFEPEWSFSLPQDASNQGLILEIVKMHKILMDANERLDKTIPKSEKVCNDQGRCGKCSYR